MILNTQRSRGFTIVELLIVIVIIGILAALVIIAYNGIQQKARNTARIASAKELQKLLAAYVIQEGKYPPSPTYACMGAGYNDWDADGSLDCWFKPGNTQHPQAAFDTEILKVVNKIPQVETSDIPGTGVTFRGYLYYPQNQTIDGQAGRRLFGYYLEGTNQNCGVPGVLTAVSGGYATNQAINTVSNDRGDTNCFIAIPGL